MQVVAVQQDLRKEREDAHRVRSCCCRDEVPVNSHCLVLSMLDIHCIIGSHLPHQSGSKVQYKAHRQILLELEQASGWEEGASKSCRLQRFVASE